MKKRIIIGIAAVAIIVGVVILFSSCTKTNKDLDDYLKTDSKLDSEALYVMPMISELGEYIDLEYVHTHRNMIVFESDSVILRAEYAKDKYEEEKMALDDRYVFYTYTDDSAGITEFEFQVNSFTFRIVSKDEDNTSGMPKSFGMIATSDKTNSIAYLYFYDFDLDELDENLMYEFMKENFEYKFK